MNIGILTFHDADNFGAVLQAYALQETLKETGNDICIINYKQKDIIKGSKLIYIRTESMTLFIKSLIYSIIHFRRKLIKKIKFKSFRKKYLNITRAKYYTGNEIQNYDMVILGSDQIWNGDLTGYDKTYFLKDNNIKTVAYAASIGKSELNNYEQDYIVNGIKSIDFISLRENNLIDYLQQYINRKIEFVLDPTLLADDKTWNKFINSKDRNNKDRNKKYILLYKMTNNNELDKAATIISNRLSLPIININHQNIAPDAFVSLFSNSSYIITNSFHGVAFSIIFRKDFVCIPHETLNSRTDSILSLLNLEQRNIRKAINIEKIDFNVDYTKASTILEIEKGKSKNYLLNALEKSSYE